MELSVEEEKLLNSIRRIIKEMLQPKRIYLFGSRAKENHNPHSDFDIAVEGHKASFRQLRKTKEELDQALGIYSFDLVELEKVSADFKELILEKGELIYERD